MESKTFKALVKLKNYVIVNNPNSLTERLLGKQLGSERFLIK